MLVCWINISDKILKHQVFYDKIICFSCEKLIKAEYTFVSNSIWFIFYQPRSNIICPHRIIVFTFLQLRLCSILCYPPSFHYLSTKDTSIFHYHLWFLHKAYPQVFYNPCNVFYPTTPGFKQINRFVEGKVLIN